MTETQIEKGSISFQTEGRLLQELGERLVAKPEVALVELIKNSYDADATFCEVSLRHRERIIVIQDDGCGMSFEQFSQRWMRIATANKVQERTSAEFKRRLTGQKGIGRFAVRFLGRSMKLDSVAWDEKRKVKTHLVADFDWVELDKQSNLEDAQIPYRLLRAEPTAKPGTRLTIGRLKDGTEFAQTASFRTAVLKIVSPISALNGGRFRRSAQEKYKDPGFKVLLPGGAEDAEVDVNLAEKVLAHAWATLSIDFTDGNLTYEIAFHDGQKKRRRHKLAPDIRNGLVADIRFFPRRSGVFSQAEVNGQEAWRWVRDNKGVAVVDHGFRISPYGMNDDDWLMLDADSAHNERDWRSNISQKLFPIPPHVKSRGDANPMLNLPSNFQLVGAVFVESSAVGSDADEALIPAMDREGFLYNDAFEQLFDIVRGGVELLAQEDRFWTQREAERKAKEARRKTRADLRAAVHFIEKSPTLTRSDKVRLVTEYTGLASRLSEVEDYDREARQRLLTMSALGVVAGFITHEASRVVASLAAALKELNYLARRHPTLKQNVDEIEQAYLALHAHLDYTKTFIDATQKGEPTEFKAAAQVRRIIEKFGQFARSRGIVVECEIDDSVRAPRMPIAVYSGILLNLYTNALKAILATETHHSTSRIVFRAENVGKWHIIDVLDNGIGIPPNLRKRVWDPLFTTTSRLNNPLGSGMGLGLSLVKQLIDQMKGRALIVDPPQGFSTCVRVQFPKG